MKKGFTMIELIFVIVILGILASVAIPRLAATRE
ncbi:prepilin-type N-terminal cleavage/methylation domain-containing protein [Campylobacter sp.]|nr:prepilin-type N-terminal cleavage/methylation domain-containing protein [Campylobacter sp.]MDD7090198.1 prepilin-type N-terminal cleavage/methylation domain-containing protein [Campylobacteraceae bacterium]MDY5284925.1 prepilin-type N-terminal cleavage/methylation domain-containing protein [Campylobacter sp.]